MMDAFVVSMLAVAVWSGLVTLRDHREEFETFTLSDIREGHMYARIYILVSVSTAFCLVDIFFRLLWVYEVGWAKFDDEWEYRWLGLHLCSGALMTYLHNTANVLLKSLDLSSVSNRTMKIFKEIVDAEEHDDDEGESYARRSS